MSQIMKAYFFCTFFGYNPYFFSRIFVLFWGDEPVATLQLNVGYLSCHNTLTKKSIKS